MFNPIDTATGGYIFNNDPNMLGGIAPSAWASGGTAVFANLISSDKDLLRTMFTQKGYPGKNAVIYSAARGGYPTNYDPTWVAVLFRIKNTTASVIGKTFHFYHSGAFSYFFSCAMDGTMLAGNNVHSSSATMSVNFGVAANSTGTLICLTASGPVANSTSTFSRLTTLAIFNNSLQLPAGLQFVDDLETATGGWGQ